MNHLHQALLTWGTAIALGMSGTALWLSIDTARQGGQTRPTAQSAAGKLSQPPPEVIALQKEKIKQLQSLLTLIQSQYDSGGTTLDEVGRVRLALDLAKVTDWHPASCPLHTAATEALLHWRFAQMQQRHAEARYRSGGETLDCVQQYSLDANQRAIAYFQARNKLPDLVRFDRQAQGFAHYPAKPVSDAVLDAMRFPAGAPSPDGESQPIPTP